MRLRKSTFTLSLLLGAVQSFGAPPPRANVLNRRQAETQRSASTPSADGERPQLQGGEDLFEQQAYAEEKNFTSRLNSLVSALRDFFTTYNAGHVIDVKKVKAVRKAWVDLEKSGWFRAEKAR
jgi:hypothetical protein